MKTFITEFFERIKSSSPEFFIKLRIAMIVTGAILIGINFLATQNVFNISDATKTILTTACNQALIIIGTITGTSFLPKEDAD